MSGAWYVKQRLQPTRSLGDAYLKYSEFNGVAGNRPTGRHIPPLYTPPYIQAKPETRSFVLDTGSNGGGSGAAEGSFLILACDGVWDVLSSEEAVRSVFGAWLLFYATRGTVLSLISCFLYEVILRVLDFLRQVCFLVDVLVFVRLL